MSEFLKPQSPLQHREGAYIYPLTTADQIIVEEDGVRLNAKLNNLVYVGEDVQEGGVAPINADTLGGQLPSYYAPTTKLTPRNLLDNSDFSNPVNQRKIAAMEQTSYVDAGTYWIDRWFALDSTSLILSVDGTVNIAPPVLGVVDCPALCQRIESGKIVASNAYTLAVKTADGGICCGSVTAPQTQSDVVSNIPIGDAGFLRLELEDGGLYRFVIGVNESKSLNLAWAALYEGEYTANNLPTYQPKGYAAELLECQRYYLPCINGDPSYLYLFMAISTGQTYGFIPTPVRMRINPTVTWEKLAFRQGASDVAAVTEIGTAVVRANGIVITIKTETGKLTTGTVYQLRSNSGSLTFSADL